MAQAYTSLSFNQLRVVLALERAVARMQAHTTLAKHLVFKGGFVLFKTLDSSRFTRDLDALAMALPKERLGTLLAEALKNDLEDFLFYTAFDHQALEEQGQYGGIRFSCAFQVGPLPTERRKQEKLSRIHIDIGFGDRVTYVRSRKMRSILKHIESVSWRVYPPEYIFAEKLQTFFERGSANSRGKDLLDMTLIYPQCVHPKRLQRAVANTFKIRSTELPESFLSKGKAFDLGMMRGAWKSVQVDHALKFEGVWTEFEKILRDLDRKSEV